MRKQPIIVKQIDPFIKWRIEKQFYRDEKIISRKADFVVSTTLICVVLIGLPLYWGVLFGWKWTHNDVIFVSSCELFLILFYLFVMYFTLNQAKTNYGRIFSKKTGEYLKTQSDSDKNWGWVLGEESIDDIREKESKDREKERVRREREAFEFDQLIKSTKPDNRKDPK